MATHTRHARVWEINASDLCGHDDGRNVSNGLRRVCKSHACSIGDLSRDTATHKHTHTHALTRHAHMALSTISHDQVNSISIFITRFDFWHATPQRSPSLHQQPHSAVSSSDRNAAGQSAGWRILSVVNTPKLHFYETLISDYVHRVRYKTQERTVSHCPKLNAIHLAACAHTLSMRTITISRLYVCATPFASA